MPIYYPSGCDAAVPDHVCDPCETKEKGRIGTVAFIKKGFVFVDPSSEAAWTAGIVSGDIILIPQVIGSFDGGAEIESAGYGRQSTQLVGYNFSANFKDPNYKSNCEFYNALKNSRSFKFAFVTETQVHLTDVAVSVIPKNPITEDLNSDVVYDVTVKWAYKDLPCPVEAPTNIFDCVYGS